jgi:hypothetical protein
MLYPAAATKAHLLFRDRKVVVHVLAAQKGFGSWLINDQKVKICS